MIEDIRMALWATADKLRTIIDADEDTLDKLMRCAGSRHVSTH